MTEQEDKLYELKKVLSFLCALGNEPTTYSVPLEYADDFAHALKNLGYKVEVARTITLRIN